MSPTAEMSPNRPQEVPVSTAGSWRPLLILAQPSGTLPREQLLEAVSPTSLRARGSPHGALLSSGWRVHLPGRCAGERLRRVLATVPGRARECGPVIPLEAVPVPFAPPCVTCSSAAGCRASLRPHGAGAGSAQGLGRAGPSFSTYLLSAYCVPAARAQTGRHPWPRGDSPIDCLQRTEESAPSAPQTKRGSGAVSGRSGPRGAAGPVAKPPACP